MLTYNYPEIADYFGRKVKLDWAEDSEHDGVDLPYYEPAIREGDAKLLLAYNDTTDSSLKHVVKATATASQLVMGDGTGAIATASQLVRGNGTGATAAAYQLVMGDGSGAAATADQLVLGDGTGVAGYFRRLNASSVISLPNSGDTGYFKSYCTPDADFIDILLITPSWYQKQQVIRLQRVSPSSYSYLNQSVNLRHVETEYDPDGAKIDCYRGMHSLQITFNGDNSTIKIPEFDVYASRLVFKKGTGVSADETLTHKYDAWNVLSGGGVYIYLLGKAYK